MPEIMHLLVYFLPPVSHPHLLPVKILTVALLPNAKGSAGIFSDSQSAGG